MKTQETRPVKYFVRMTLSQRIQHLLLMISFILLAVTGFALRYADTAWAQWLVRAMGGYEARAHIHRGAAGIMMLVTLYHFASLGVGAFIHRRRILSQKISSLPLMWSMKDWHDFKLTILYYLGRTPEPPKYGKYSYVEKVEYWSFVWGIAVMGVSGIILSVPFKALEIFPKWVVKVSFIVHSYEAALAVMAIVIWHLYTVHFAPDVFPMNRVWITGKISEDELKERHPLEYERLMQKTEGLEGSEATDTVPSR
jgi:formate dehydrogenase subunit gamma